MGDTSISWTDKTWNPIRGCSRVSAGCVNCYAERVAHRFSGTGQPYAGLTTVKGRWNGEVRFVAEHLADPLRWKKPRRIFVNSMSDLFHESLTNEQIAAVFGVMAAAPQHTFQVLTKRAERMREWFEWVAEMSRSSTAYDCTFFNHLASQHGADGASWIRWCEDSEDIHAPWPLSNVWIGASVENQEAANERIPDLLASPAAIRFLSCEPLLGALELPRHGQPMGRSFSPLDWVIAGCESGSSARPADVTWFRSLRDQCADTRVPFFLKQVVCELTLSGRGEPITFGPGSKCKAGGVLELPYLDGVQHAAFPR